jgi:hypothetical protein
MHLSELDDGDDGGDDDGDDHGNDDDDYDGDSQGSGSLPGTNLIKLLFFPSIAKVCHNKLERLTPTIIFGLVGSLLENTQS